ncbi:hypothetical protein SBADM41S_05992 [Streptomyces badius]
MDPDLQHAPATQGALGNLHVVGVVDDALHEVLESLLEHVSGLGRLGGLGSVSRLVRLLVGLLGLGGDGLTLGLVAVRGQRLEQRALVSLGLRLQQRRGGREALVGLPVPVSFRIARTGSVGWAPTDSQ